MGRNTHEVCIVTAPQICEQIGLNVVPRLQEFGVEAFVLVAYVKDGEGKISRVTLGGVGNHPGYQDGLRPMEQAAEKWGRGEL